MREGRSGQGARGQKTGDELLGYPGGRYALAEELGDQLIVGQSFVFLGPHWSDRPSISAILSLAGVRHLEPQIFCRWGEGILTVPGAQIRRRAVPLVDLCALWSDRPLYREAKDTVTLWLVNPLAPQTSHRLELFWEGQPVRELFVETDGQGIARLQLSDMAAGAYRIQVSGRQASVRFSVVQERLVALEGELLRHYFQQIAGGRYVLVFVARLESFGAPLRGDVAVEVIDEGGESPHPVAGASFRPDGAGRVAGELPLTGEGPFSLQIQSLVYPEKSCVLPLSEGLPHEEEIFVLGPLGQVQQARLVGDGAWRGLDVVDCQLHNQSPVALEELVTPRAVLRGQQELLQPLIALIDPLQGTVEERKMERWSPQERIEWEVPRPFGLIAIGGFWSGRPWEGWTFVLPPLQWKLHLAARPSAPGAVEVQLHTGRAESLPVIVTATELEPEQGSSPEEPAGNTALAEALLESMGALTQDLGVGLQERPMIEAAPPPPQPPGRGIPPLGGIPAPAGPNPFLAGIASASQPYGMGAGAASLAQGPSGAEGGALPGGEGIPPRWGDSAAESFVPGSGDATAGDAWVRPLPGGEELARTFFCARIDVQGESRFELSLPDDAGSCRVEALALNGIDWSQASEILRLSPPTRAQLCLPAFFHPHDQLQGEIRLRSTGEAVRLFLQRDNQPVPLKLAGKKLPENNLLQQQKASLTFAATPGTYRLELRNKEGQLLQQQEDELTSLEEDHPFLRYGAYLLREGQEVDRQERRWESAVLLSEIRPLLLRLAEALLQFPEEENEPLAAKALAAAFLYRYAPHPLEQERASHLLQVAAGQLEQLWMPGLGLRQMVRGNPDTTWGPVAVRHLWDVGFVLRQAEVDAPLAQALERIRTIADDAGRGYRLEPAPLRIGQPREAYIVCREEQQALARVQEATYWLKERMTSDASGQPQLLGQGLVSTREATAYSAAALLAGGQPADLDEGLQMTNHLLAQLNDKGRLASTVDSVALLFLLHQCSSLLSPPGACALSVNGQAMELEGALQLERVEQVEVLRGLVALGFTQQATPAPLAREEVPLQAILRSPGAPSPSSGALSSGAHLPGTTPPALGGAAPRSSPQEGGAFVQCQVGQRLLLSLSLPGGGQRGDRLEVWLPPALSWQEGAKGTRSFTLQLQGETQWEIPLVATAPTLTPQGELAPQHAALRLSNLYRQERLGQRDDLALLVTPPGHKAPLRERMAAGLKKIFG